MGFHGAWHGVIHSTDEKPKITWNLLQRVMSFAKPYRWLIAGMMLLILINTILTLLTPLIVRDLIDNTIPSGNV